MSFQPHDYLRHILVEVEYLLDQSQGLNFERFAADETLRRAFLRSLEVIGEAVKNLPEEFRASHSKVEWRFDCSDAGPPHSRLLRGGLSARMGCSAGEASRTKT
jgi:hypothetical protein